MDIMAMSFVGILTKNIQGSNETKNEERKKKLHSCARVEDRRGNASRSRDKANVGCYFKPSVLFAFS